MKSLLKVKHRQQVINFRSSVFHLSAASLLFFLKDGYKSIDTAGLYALLAKKLMQAPKFGAISVNFTLVNLYNNSNGFSHGCSVPPPEDIRPANHHLVFTFSFSPLDSVTDLGPITVKNFRSNSVSQYGNMSEPLAFTSIGLTSSECARFGLNALYTQHMAYLYNIIGVMTKSLARHKQYYETGTFDDLYGENLKAAHDRFGSRSLYQVVLSQPYPYWVYNTSLWHYGGNLLGRQMIVPQTALYYFCYVHGAVSHFAAHDRTANLLGVNNAAEGTILGHLSDSILQFVQNVNQPGYEHRSALDVLAPNVILSLVMTGSPKIELQGSSDSEIWDNLRAVARRLSRAFADLDTNIGELFLPADGTAIKLFRADHNYIDRLTSELDFSKL